MKLIKCLLFCSIVSANLFQGMSFCFWSYKTTVEVFSRLPQNSPALVVHCASRDDDIGWHRLAPNQGFNFRFCVKPFTTLFFCHLWWGNKNKAVVAFNAKWIFDRCYRHTCTWEAQSDGIYLSGKKDYDWESTTV